jgi:hypothetical protein
MGYNDGAAIGTLKYVLRSSGRATMNFGNCWNAGIVKVYLNGEIIAQAGPHQELNVISFLYEDGQYQYLSPLLTSTKALLEGCWGGGGEKCCSTPGQKHPTSKGVSRSHGY